MNITLALNLSQLAFTIIGVVSGVVLFIKSNLEKKNLFIINIYDRFYNDKDISKILYYADKELNCNKICYDGEFERETDKTLRFLDLIGQLIKDRHLNKNDIHIFKYEIEIILNNVEVRNYLKTLLQAGVVLKNLDSLL
jgi:hypothetical protein